MSKSDPILARALAYPYDIPASSFTLRRGRTTRFDPAACAGRTPVLAVGSNRSPQQLRRKFGATDEALPVQRARLWDHDAVYSAHLTTYGAVPATLRHIAGTVVDIAVTWLSQGQLDRMHETELPHGNYDYVRLDSLRVELDGGGTVTGVFAYRSRRGHLASAAGQAIALAAIAAANRKLQAMSQPAALDHARAALAPDDHLRDFVRTTVTDHAQRRRYIGVLQEQAVAPHHWPDTSVALAADDYCKN